MSAAAVDLTGRAALVTGAGRGIGRAIATLFAEHGATVAVHYRADTAAAENTVASLTGEGHTAIAADLADPRSAFDLADRAASPVRSVCFTAQSVTSSPPAADTSST